LHSLFKIINKYGSKKNIIFGIFIIIVFNVILFPKFAELFLGVKIDIKSILDVKFSYTTTMAYTLFNHLGKDGRNAYKLSELLIDIPYAIIYGFVYTFILNSFKKLKNYKALILVPLLISFFDLLENSGIIFMLTKYPIKLAIICNLTSIFTSLKWIFAIVTFVLISTNLVWLIIAKISSKKHIIN